MRKKIGDVLVEAGLVTTEQIQSALTLQKGKNKRLGKILMELGYVTEMQIAEALSRLLSVRFVDCRSFIISREVLATVPKDVAEKKVVFPLELTDKRLLLAMADPLDWQTVDDISFNTGLRVSVVISTESSILDLLEEHYGSATKTYDLLKEIPGYEGVEFIKEAEEEEKKGQIAGSFCSIAESPPIVKLVTMIIADAVTSRGSDIHIEPQENHVQVRYRIDGELRNILKYPKHIQDSVISRIKIISNLDITNRRLPQDGRSTLRFGDKKIDLRISTLPSIYGEKIVIRLLDQSQGIATLSQMGMDKRLLTPLLELTDQPQGMLLVTGPTGSGKTSSLYAILQHLKSETENIITIEDPVEYKLPGITQVGVNEPIGLTFASVLRSVLRQDPDIIMVGEIRDRETAEIAAQAALTGHMVLSTLHTNDTVATITRLLDIGIEPFLVSSAVSAILAQRLVRRICPKCRAEELPEDLDRLGLPPLAAASRGTGCKMCQNTGYLGRIGVYEYLPLGTRLKRAIARQASEEELWELAREAGTIPLFDAAWELVRTGVTTVEEVISKIPYKHLEGLPGRTEVKVKNKVLLLGVAQPELIRLRDILEPEGYAVVSAREEESSDTTRRETPDVVILDAAVARKTALRKLREDVRNIYLPVIALADLDDKELEAEGISAGVSLFIYRPVEAQQLLAAVRRSGVGDHEEAPCFRIRAALPPSLSEAGH